MDLYYLLILASITITLLLNFLKAPLRHRITAHIYERRKSLENRELHLLIPSYNFRLHDGPLGYQGIGYDMRTPQELLATTIFVPPLIYTHVLNRGRKGERILLEIFTKEGHPCG